MRLKRIPVSEDIIHEMLAHKERTQLGAMALFNGRREELPVGLTSSKVNAWISGATRTALPEDIEFVLQLWASTPDYEPLSSQSNPIAEDENRWVEIDSDFIEEIKLHLNRSGVNIRRLAGKSSPGRTRDLNPAFIYRWLSGQTRKAKHRHIEWVLLRLRSLPDKAIKVRRIKRIQLTDDVLEELESLIEKTNLNPADMLKSHIGENFNGLDEIPKGLTSRTINGWRSKAIINAKAGQFDWVVKQYERALV